MRQIISFRGTEDEVNALVLAVNRNCNQADGKPCDSTCPAHGLMRDQNTLDRLLFLRRIADRLLEGEFETRPLPH